VTAATYRAYTDAAFKLAAAAEFADRLQNNPDVAADRSEQAERYRADEMRAALDAYRAAEADFLTEVTS